MATASCTAANFIVLRPIAGALQVCLAPGQWAAVCDFYASCHPKPIAPDAASPSAAPPAEISSTADPSALVQPAVMAAGSLSQSIVLLPTHTPTASDQPTSEQPYSASPPSNAAAVQPYGWVRPLQGSLPYSLATGCCSQLLTSGMEDLSLSPAEAPASQRPAAQRAPGDEPSHPTDSSCTHAPETAPADCDDPRGTSRSRRVEQATSKHHDAAVPMLSGTPGVVPDPSSSPFHQSHHTHHRADSRQGGPQEHEAEGMVTHTQVDAPAEAHSQGLQPTLAATGHQRIDDYCWTALHSDGSLESLHSSTSF